jgi:hypothetical protein
MFRKFTVVDHRNKVVAFTGVGHLLPDMTGARRSIENVSIWKGEFKNYPKILNFASEITYGGTKIGEFFVGLSATEGLRQSIYNRSCFKRLDFIVCNFYLTFPKYQVDTDEVGRF